MKVIAEQQSRKINLMYRKINWILKRLISILLHIQMTMNASEIFTLLSIGIVFFEEKLSLNERLH